MSALSFLPQVRFERGIPIGPPLKDDSWPGQRQHPLYWRAHATLQLSGPPEGDEISMLVDRHYEVYINGQLSIQQRGFFSGDQYLYAQRWPNKLTPLLTAGANQIDVIVRTDPWSNKNYRTYRPLMVLEGTVRCGRHEVAVATDTSWQVATIDDWRHFIALSACETIHYERVVVPPSTQAELAGFAPVKGMSPAVVLDAAELPPVYRWDDRPKRIDDKMPRELVGAGTCDWICDQLIFDLSKRDQRGDVDDPLELVARFVTPDAAELALTSSALAHCRIEVNGQLQYEGNGAPDRHQMGLPNYQVPVVRAVSRRGENTLKIQVYPKAWLSPHYHCAVQGCPALMDPGVWTDGDGSPLSPTSAKMEISEQVGSKISDRCPDRAHFRDGQLVVDATSSGQRVYAILDMGEVVCGRLSLQCQSASTGRINLAYGFDVRHDALDCYRMHLRAVDVLEMPEGTSRYDAFDVRTFRYIDLVFEGFKGKVTLSDLILKEQVFSLVGAARFKSSQEQTNDMWMASVRTAQLCAQELYMDNPEREHAQWVDNLAVGAGVGYYVFGESVKVTKAYADLAVTQQPDGQLAGYAPGKWFPRDPLQCHMCLFILGCERHFMHTGDEAFADRMFPVMTRMLSHFERCRTSQGLISDLHALFVDWGSHIYSYKRLSQGPTGALTSLNSYYRGALSSVARMGRWINQAELSERYEQIAADVKQAMCQQLYDANQGMFRDGCGDQEAESNFSQTANALAAWFDATPDAERAAVLERAFAPEPALNMIPANAHFAMQAGSAMFEAGCDRLALRWLRNGFGPMLNRGPGTFWETFEPYASLCQGTGGGPAYLLSRYVGGLYPVEPGYRVIGIDPHPGDLESLHATFVTPVGRADVRWEVVNGKVVYHLGQPAEWEGRPCVAGDNVQVTVTSR